MHSYAFCPIEQYKLAGAFELVQPVKIDCAICEGYLFLIVLPSDEMVKPAKIANLQFLEVYRFYTTYVNRFD